LSAAALARLRRRFHVREESEGVAFAIEQMLGLPATEARRLARAGSARRLKLYSACVSSPAAHALRALRDVRPSSDLSPLVGELGRHAGESYILALPLTVDAVLLLAELAADERQRFVVMSTPLTRAYLQPLVESSEGARVSFVSSGEMVMHNRGRAGGGRPGPVTYVTFPDHQGTRGDTMWHVPFLSDQHKFSTVEPLLFFRGLPLLFTLGAEEAGGLRLARYAGGAQTAAAPSEAEVRAVLDWLARQLETVFRRRPDEVLSWEFAQERSSRLMTQITVMKLKIVEGYVRAWGEAGAGLDAASCDRAAAELRKLQEVAYNSAEPRGVAG
jgi:hypothetical protein